MAAEERSKAFYERAVKRLPGGVNSPVRAYQAVGRTPRFIQSAKGAHITDVDGNEMIDYVCSWGPGILGHANPKVVEKVKAACDEGLTFGAPTEREVEMAELLAELVPSMEVSRLVSSGTEATYSTPSGRGVLCIASTRPVKSTFFTIRPYFLKRASVTSKICIGLSSFYHIIL